MLGTPESRIAGCASRQGSSTPHSPKDSKPEAKQNGAAQPHIVCAGPDTSSTVPGNELPVKGVSGLGTKEAQRTLSQMNLKFLVQPKILFFGVRF